MTEGTSSEGLDTRTGDAARSDPRIFCFERLEEEAAFERSVTRLIGDLQKRDRASFVSPHNVLRFNHGRQWVHSARDSEIDTEMHSIATEWVIPFNEIADNNLGMIARTVVPVSDDMSRQFAQNMYGTVASAAERAGNVVDGKAAGSMAACLLEMMSKIEFGVDREGKVSMPQIHLGSEARRKYVKALEDMDPETSAQLERLHVEKSQRALQREAERRAKFLRAPE